MTTWIEEPETGRGRGVRAVVRAWVEVLVRPRRFFRSGVAPGDQAPGLTFVLGVVAVAAGSHLATQPAYATVVGEYPMLSVVLVFLLYVFVVAPVVLHLAAAVATIGLMGVVDRERRGGVSETVQVLAYACAPCVFAGLPFPVLRVVCAVYGVWLVVIGMRVVHSASWGEAVGVSVVPATVVFGYGFGGIAAGRALIAALG